MKVLSHKSIALYGGGLTPTEYQMPRRKQVTLSDHMLNDRLKMRKAMWDGKLPYRIAREMNGNNKNDLQHVMIHDVLLGGGAGGELLLNKKIPLE